MNAPVCIWIEAEEWAPGEWDIYDGNTDVHVTLADGTRWVATFFSYRNVLSLTKKYKGTGECMAGEYFWASDMILVDEVSRERIEQVVKHLAETPDEFRSVFRQTVAGGDGVNQ
jgi:hypothetical protein